MSDPATTLSASWLADLPIWLQHRDKVPHYSGSRPKPRTGALDTPEDRSKLVRFRDLKLAEGFEPGYALGPVSDSLVLCGVDLDKCFDANGKVIEPLKDFCSIARRTGAMTEVSRSGTGLHVVWLAPHDQVPPTFKREGVESYTRGRFFARGSRVIDGGSPTPLVMTPAFDFLPMAKLKEAKPVERTDRGIDPKGGRNNYLRERLEMFAFAGLTGETLKQAIFDENAKLVDPLDEEEIKATIFKGIDKLYIQPKTPPSQVFEPVEVVEAPKWKVTPTRAKLRVQPEPVQFAVDGWMQERKVGLIASEGGTGKTTLLIHMGICIVTGRPFMGNAVKQGPFMLFSRDDDQDDLDAVVQEVSIALALTDDECATVARDLYVVSLRSRADYMLISSPDGRTFKPSPFVPHLTAEVKRVKPVCVAIDTVRQFSGIESTHEGGQIVFMSVCAALAELGPAVIVAHHVGKQAAREKIVDMYSAIGSSALADNARFMWRLLKIEPQEIEAGEVKLPFDTALPAGSDLLQLISTRGSLRVKRPGDVFYTRQNFALDLVGGNVTKLTGDALKAERQRRREEKQAEIVAAGRAEKLAHLVECFRAEGVIGRERAATFFKARGWPVIDSNFWSELKADAEAQVEMES